MIPIGLRQNLRIDRLKPHGAYLTHPEEAQEDSQDVLLPRKELKESMKPGDLLDVFVYRDSDDRRIATLRQPKIQIGTPAVLRVKEVTKIGAFLDWGLEKDLLLPFAEQNTRLHKGQEVFVRLYIDKSDRLAASQKMQGALQTHPPYQINDWVEGRVISRHPKIGAFIAVDDIYEALLPERNIYRALEPLAVMKFRVQQVREDGRLVLSLRDRAVAVMDTDSELIREALERAGGYLPVDDTTHPDLIRQEFGISKASFKRAVGRLLKQGEIRFTRGGIAATKKGGHSGTRRQNHRTGRR